MNLCRKWNTQACRVSFSNNRCPTLSEIRKSVRFKRNGAAAGLNSLTYVPYKKCPAIWTILAKLFRKVWQTRTVPDSWASAFIVLISKSDKVHLPSEFRPIAITNTVGKILLDNFCKAWKIHGFQQIHRQHYPKGFPCRDAWVPCTCVHVVWIPAGCQMRKKSRKPGLTLRMSMDPYVIICSSC